MAQYLLRRLMQVVPILLVTSFIIFAVVALAPGDPMSQFASNPAVPPEVRDDIRRSLGLDQPWPVRYFKWLKTLVTEGNFGYSFTSRMPVTDLVLQRLPVTVVVLGAAYLIGIVVAIPTGVIAAVKQYSIFDHVATTIAYVGYSIPTFFSGLILILVFGVRLQWFPWMYDSTLKVKDLGSAVRMLYQSVLPITVLAFAQTATLTRYVRASVLENLRMDYVRTARGKGLAEQLVIWRHVLRNSLIPVVTLMALRIPAVFTGSVITEQIFRVPGIGALLIRSIETGDTPVVMGITFTYALLVVIFNLIADVLYGVLDPTVKYD